MIRQSLLLVALLALSAQPACASTRRAPPTPDLVEDALAFAAADRGKAIELLEQSLQQGEVAPQDELLVMAHAGEQRRLAGQGQLAHQWFTTVLQRASDGPAQATARLGLALLAAEGGPDEATLRVLAEVPEREVLASQNADRFLVLAVEAARVDDPAALRDHTRRALTHARNDPEQEARVRARLAALAQGEHDAPAVGEQGTPLERAEAAFAEGRLDEARLLAEAVMAEDPDGDEGLVAHYLVRRIEANRPVDPGRIGVLLPLSGRFEAAGRQIRQALELGYGEANARRRLVVVDEGDGAAEAVAALERLVLEEGVVAVLGPLRSDVAPEVVRAADALRVPLINLAPVADVVESRDWAFQGMITPRDQVQALLDHVMGTREMQAFGVFAPDNAYGRTTAALFREEVEARGGEITVETFYDPEANDLIPFAESLGRKDYESRARELRELREEAQRRGGNPDRVVLPPVVDFDALFVPDNASRVQLAGAGLAYEEFPIGDFRPTRDSEPVPLLGLSGWNSEVLLRAGPYVRSSVFTDVFFPAGPEADALEARFREALQRAPSPLEAVAHDAGRLLAAAALKDAADRAAFRDVLLKVRAEGLATGTEGFDEARSARHRVRLLTVTRDGIVPLDDP